MRSLALFVVLLLVWLSWSGHFEAFLISVGVGCCAAVAWLATRMGLVDEEGVPYEITPRALAYLPYLTREVIKANVDVARRVLHPRLPIGPRLIRTRALERTDLGRVIYANSITLTPGTVTIGVDGDELEVHALTEEAADDVLTDAMNRRVQAVEGHRR